VTEDINPQPADDQTDDRVENLARRLGLSFTDPGILRLALTHRSVVHELRMSGDQFGADSQLSNERLEFLGDSVLGYVVAKAVYERFPLATEGELTARRVSLVRAEQLVIWARSIDLGSSIYLAQGERITEGSRDRILANSFEALVGAITIDQGISAAQDFMARFLERDIDNALEANIAANPKGQLQEYLQELYRQPPVYRIVDVTGPEHARIFTAEVLADGQSLGTGAGESKRSAEQAAADQALLHLNQLGRPESTKQVRTRRGITRVKGTTSAHGQVL
jgi:ribonuclease-3